MDHTFADLFRQFFWMVFPIFGMGVGAWAIWNEYSRQKKALEVLKVYAEKGQEPPESVLEVLTRASTPTPRRSRSALSRAVFFGVLTVGFAFMAVWTHANSGPFQFVTGWSIAAIALGALCASNLVAALTKPPENDQ